jgi:hypothetical protein
MKEVKGMEKNKKVHTTLTEDEVDEINDNLSVINGFVEMVMALYSSDQLDAMDPAEIITNGIETFNRIKEIQDILNKEEETTESETTN